MISQLRYQVRDLLKLTLWLAVACTAGRLLYFPDSRLWIEKGTLIALLSMFIIAPCAALGAMFDRFWEGAFCGLGIILLFVLTILLGNTL